MNFWQIMKPEVWHEWVLLIVVLLAATAVVVLSVIQVYLITQCSSNGGEMVGTGEYQVILINNVPVTQEVRECSLDKG